MPSNSVGTATVEQADAGGFGADFGLSFGAVTALGPATAVVAQLAGTAVLAGNGTGTAALAKDGISTATLTEAHDLAELQLV